MERRRVKGDGCIYENKNSKSKKDKFFGYVLTEKFNSNGNKIRKKFQGSSYKEVSEKIKNYNNSGKHENIEELMFLDSYDFLIKLYENKKAKKLKTKNVLETIWNNQIVPVFSGYKLTGVTPEIVINAITEWTRCFSISTAQKAFNYSRKAFRVTNFEYNNELPDPFLNVRFADYSIMREYDGFDKKPLKKMTKQKNYFTDDEIRTLIQAFNKEAEKSKLLPQYKDLKYINENKYADIISILWDTGLRINELLALTWADIDFDNKLINISKTLTEVKENGKWVIRITTPKTLSSNRPIPMINTTFSKLKKIKKLTCDDNCEIVFHTSNNSYIRLSNLSRRFRKIAKINNISGTIHMLRHTNIVNANSDLALLGADSGVTINDISRVEGHSATYMTEKYDEEKIERAKRVGEFREKAQVVRTEMQVKNRSKSKNLLTYLDLSRDVLIKRLMKKFDDGQYSNYNKDDIKDYFLWKYEFFKENIINYNRNYKKIFANSDDDLMTFTDNLNKKRIRYALKLIDEKYAKKEKEKISVEYLNFFEGTAPTILPCSIDNVKEVNQSEKDVRPLLEKYMILTYPEYHEDDIHKSKHWKDLEITAHEMNFFEEEFDYFIDYKEKQNLAVLPEWT